MMFTAAGWSHKSLHGLTATSVTSLLAHLPCLTFPIFLPHAPSAALPWERFGKWSWQLEVGLTGTGTDGAQGIQGLPWWLSSKEFACNSGNGSIPGSGRSPGGQHGNPLLPGASMDRGAWRAIVHRVAKSRTRLKGLNTHTYKGYRLQGPQRCPSTPPTPCSTSSPSCPMAE